MVIAKRIVMYTGEVIEEAVEIPRWRLGKCGHTGSYNSCMDTEYVYIREAESSDYKDFDFETMTGTRK